MLTSALLAVGTAAVAPLLNVVFHEGHIHAGEGEIGVVFAAGELSLAAATLLVPLVAARMLKVDAIALMRVLSLPFILAMGLLPLALGEGALLIVLAGAEARRANVHLPHEPPASTTLSTWRCWSHASAPPAPA